MPIKAKHPCSFNGCPNLTLTKYCPGHSHLQLSEIQTQRQRLDANRDPEIRKFYNTPHWINYSKNYRINHPFCAICKRAHTQVVDHIIPHKGDYELFWDESNHQPACKPCHDAKTAREDGGYGRMRKVVQL
jgi:5-methylcytosine-specific restriction protein A